MTEKNLEESNEAVIAVLDAPPEREEKRRHDPKEKNKNKREPNYHVIIWNDEEHSYGYVIEMLMKLFGHSYDVAYAITHEVDKSGKGIAWTCHQEIAELKRDQILAYGPDPTMKISKGSIRATIEPAPE